MPDGFLPEEGFYPDDSEPSVSARILRQGPMKAARDHECIDCGRPLRRTENGWVRVTLTVDSAWRHVLAEYSCCRPLD